MKNEELSRPDIASPLDVAEAVIAECGYDIVPTPEDTAIVGLAIPNGLGGCCEAVVEHFEGTSMLQLTTSLTSGDVNPYLHHGLRQLLNELNLRFSGLCFTFDDDEEQGDEIEISISCFVAGEKEIEQSLKFMLRYLEEALKVTLPVIYYYITQKLVYSLATDGSVVGIRTKVKVDDVLEMMEVGPLIGHA